MSPFDRLLDLVGASPWTYPLVFGLVLLDADVPVLPGETVLLTAAIAAADGELLLWLAALVGIAGALIGDHVSCWIGRRFGRDVYFHFFRSESSRRRFEWTRDMLERHSAWIIPAIRFVPGGRTAVTLASGAVELRWRDFFLADAAGVLLWAALYSALGYFWGHVFEGRSWAAFLVSFGMAGLVMLGGWVWQVRRQRADDVR